MKIRKRVKKCVALLEGKVLVEDCLKAALDNNMMLEDLKRLLVLENKGQKVTFIYK